jgi:transposase
MVHVGLDLHHCNSYIRALTEEGELIKGQRIYHNQIDQLWQYLNQFGDQTKRVVFEATSNARWMYRLLRTDPTVEPVAVTPHKVRIIAETVAKTDKIDATVLASLSKMDALPMAWIPDEDVENLREMIRYRAALVGLRSSAKNRVNGVLIRQGKLKPYEDVFGTLGRDWLKQVQLPPVMRLQIDQWLHLIDQYQKNIKDIEKKLYKDLAVANRWSSDMEILDTMPGWGKLTALTVLAELGDYRRFRCRGAVSCFAGLVPSSKRSDKSCRYGRITRRGSRYLRTILVEASISGARKVPRYRELYNRVKAAKKHNVAKVAVARQMLEDGWTMLIKREPFRLFADEAVNLTRAGCNL